MLGTGIVINRNSHPALPFARTSPQLELAGPNGSLYTLQSSAVWRAAMKIRITTTTRLLYTVQGKSNDLYTAASRYGDSPTLPKLTP